MEGQRVDPYNVLKVNAPGQLRRDAEIYSRHNFPQTSKETLPAPAATSEGVSGSGSSIMRLKN